MKMIPIESDRYLSKIGNIIQVSKEVIRDSQLDNGAIVAANAAKDYYPPAAQNYFFVWPRDASYTCIAADLAGIGDMQEKFFNWCLRRAEGFKDTGLFYEKYHVNGLKAQGGFHPDQTGTLLYAIWHHYYKNIEMGFKFEDLIIKSANGLCNIWEKDHFNMITKDLWEERFTFPDLKDNFTYSLAACISGLECANSMIANKRWLMVSEQMRMQLEEHFVDNYFVRSYGKLTDRYIDASMLGLVYPFKIYKADDLKIISTLDEIENKLIINGGVHRYEMDMYDGWMYEMINRRKGAGAWPVLNFWLSIYYSIKGDNVKAKKCYRWVLDNVNKYIPEQIFENKIQISISPLVWSHTMFVIASKHLEYL